MATSKRSTLWGLLAVLGIAQAVWDRSQVQPMYTEKIMPKNRGYVNGLSPEQFLLALSGFREMIAGILWVKGDSFFDSGNYDAILPIIRLVTWLDPHQIDVYATGIWHIGYNFTDEQSRSDRRYLPSAIALGKEGAQNNPDTFEMFFETGWLWYHKIDDDYPQAVKYWEQAIQHKDMIPARKNLLANAYQRSGDIDKAMGYYKSLLTDAEKAMDKSMDFSTRISRDTIEGNLDTMLVRMSQRGYWGRKLGIKSPVPYDTDPPFNVNFSVQVTVPEPKVVRFEGHWGVRPVGTRIRVILRDEDYPFASPGGMQWDQGSGVNLDPPKDLTFMQDQLYVKNQRFDRTCDMSRDPPCTPSNRRSSWSSFTTTRAVHRPTFRTSSDGAAKGSRTTTISTRRFVPEPACSITVWNSRKTKSCAAENGAWGAARCRLSRRQTTWTSRLRVPRNLSKFLASSAPRSRVGEYTGERNSAGNRATSGW